MNYLQIFLGFLLIFVPLILAIAIKVLDAKSVTAALLTTYLFWLPFLFLAPAGFMVLVSVFRS